MKALLIIWLFIGVVATPSYAELTQHPHDQDTEADTEVREKDVEAVIQIRRALETEYLGGKYSIGPAQNEAMRAYINWLMAPLEALVNKKQLIVNLRFKPVGGPSGVGKTAVARKFVAMTEAAGLLVEKRKFYQQGDPALSMELSKIDGLGRTSEELKLAGPTGRYIDVKARFLMTFAMVVFDEASHYGSPPGDLDKAYEIEKEQLKKNLVAKKLAIAAKIKPEPQRPKQEDFKVEIDGQSHFDDTAFTKAEIEYEFDHIEWEATRDEKKEEVNIKEEIDKLKLKYDRLRFDRATLERSMRRIWQAASGGKVIETEEREDADTFKSDIIASQVAITRFKAKHKQDGLLETIEGQRRQINAKVNEAKAARTAQAKIKQQFDGLQRHYDNFAGVTVRNIEQWAIATKRVDDLARMDRRMLDQEFITTMLEEMRSNPHILTQHQVGFRLTQRGKEKELKHEELTRRFQSMILGHYQTQIDDLKVEYHRYSNQITELEEAVEPLIEVQKAYKRAVVEEGLPNPGREKLVTEFRGLLDSHHQRVLEASRSKPAMYEINKFIANLTPTGLYEHAADYYKHLETLGTPIGEYIKNLQNCDNIEIKFAQMLLMDTKHARDMVVSAVTETGYKTEELDFGGINVVMTFNPLEVEDFVTEWLEDAKNSGRKMTFGEMAELYELAVDEAWAQRFFEKQFPRLFKPDGHKSVGTGQAATRRFFGDVGPFYFFPLNELQMMNSVMSTIDSQVLEWEKSFQSKGFKVNVDLFIHQNVPALFIRDGVHPEFGPNSVLETVREAMGGLLDELSAVAIRKTKEAGLNGDKRNFNTKLVLVNEPKPGGAQNLRLRFLPWDYESKEWVLSELPPDLADKDIIGEWRHNFEPSQSMKDALEKAGLADVIKPVKPEDVVKAAEEGDGEKKLTFNTKEEHQAHLDKIEDERLYQLRLDEQRRARELQVRIDRENAEEQRQFKAVSDQKLVEEQSRRYRWLDQMGKPEKICRWFFRMLKTPPRKFP